MNILHIDSSILGDASISRRLSAAVVARLRELSVDATVTYRDLAASPLEHLSAALAQPAVAAGEPALLEQLATRAAVLEEVLTADTLVVAAPMYNFGIPSQLKAWLDALAVPGKTFNYGANGAQGLLGGKRLILVSTQGGHYGAGSVLAPLEHQESHVHGFFGFLGIRDIEVVRAAGMRMSAEQAEQALATALAQAAALEHVALI